MSYFLDYLVAQWEGGAGRPGRRLGGTQAVMRRWYGFTADAYGKGENQSGGHSPGTRE